MNTVASEQRDRADQRASQIRLIVRQGTALLLARGELLNPVLPPERLAGLVLETVLSASIAHLPYRATTGEPRWLGLEAAAEQARKVSVLAVARSLNLPYGTVARRAEELVASGSLLKESRGVRVSPAFLADSRLAAVAERNKANLRSVLSMLAAAGYAPAPDLLTPGFEHLPASVVERAILTFSLRVLETITDLYGDAINGTLAATVTAINVHHLTQDPTLSRRFAGEDTPPPDDLRRPVPVRDLARRMSMPFETVRRRIKELQARGVIMALDDGVIVPARVLTSPKHLADNRRIVRHFEQMLNLLSGLAAASR